MVSKGREKEEIGGVIMTKRTKPDTNQASIEKAINRSPGCQFIDTHNVPYNLPELAGFPDGLIAAEDGLTVVCEDVELTVAALKHIPGVKVLRGAIIPVEVKTESGQLRKSQKAWGQRYGVESVVLRVVVEVFALLGVNYD